MSLLLCIDTTTNVCSVALVKDGQLIGQKEDRKKQTHASLLTIFIQELLQQHQYTLQDLTAIAISSGPGSYTGLRIGTTTAKGLCYSLAIPLLAIDTLAALSWRCIQQHGHTLNKDCLYVPLMDARRMEVYTAIYDGKLTCHEATQAKIIDEFAFANYQNQPLVFFGNGMDKCKHILAGENRYFIENCACVATNLVGLAYEAYKQQAFVNTIYYEPTYGKQFIPIVKSKPFL